ncbi:hypothetical protein N825_37580 [Skermanella stibiiresistens SB22]|uniref:OTU domain-containing protein n=1 Tax=Skermanella stibiiresistens SB22 TaxID=1385369 RepID=W9GP93_9PROT|nr:hypothetical protein N825_37580 [Skermanella stibiiresistens SB22]
MPGLRLGSRSRTSTPFSAKRRCQRQTDGRLTPACRAISQHRQAIAGQKDDPDPLHMLERAVAIPDDGRQSLEVFRANDDANCLSHELRLA